MFVVHGKYLVKSNSHLPQINYRIIRSIGVSIGDVPPCIVVENLNPDYYLLFGSLKLIVTENGSVLSHLAIIAREYHISVFLSNEEIIEKITEEGTLSLKENI